MKLFRPKFCSLGFYLSLIFLGLNVSAASKIEKASEKSSKPLSESAVLSKLIYKNEFFHAPKRNESEITALYVTGPSGKRSVDGTEYLYSGYVLNLTYMYGFDYNTSFGANISTGEKKTDDSSNFWKEKGLSDITLKIKSEFEVYKYGADWILSTNTRKIGSSLADGNRYNGGMALVPYFGYMNTDYEFNWGGKVDYTYYFDRKLDEAGDPTLTEGNILGLTAFAEIDYGQGFLGASYKLKNAADYKKTTGSTTRTYTSDVPDEFKVYSTLDIGIATLLAEYEIQKWKYINDSNVAGGTKKEAYTSTSINFGARIAF